MITDNDRKTYAECQFDTCMVCNSHQQNKCCEIRNEELLCTVSLTLDELATRFNELMIEPRPAAGFTIGQGKKLYWYITPYTDHYRCLPIVPNGELGCPRWCKPIQKVTVHYPIEYHNREVILDRIKGCPSSGAPEKC